MNDKPSVNHPPARLPVRRRLRDLAVSVTAGVLVVVASIRLSGADEGNPQPVDVAATVATLALLALTARVARRYRGRHRRTRRDVSTRDG